MPSPKEGTHATALSCRVPKSLLQVLAFFNGKREGLCSEIVRVTGLSHKTVRRRLKVLAEKGMLDILSTKTFPRARRFRLLSDSGEIARYAYSLLQTLESQGSVSFALIPDKECENGTLHMLVRKKQLPYVESKKQAAIPLEK